MTNTEHIRQRIYAYMRENATPQPFTKTLDDLTASEWSQEFERLMRNRLLVGCFRYGPMSDPAKGRYDNLGSAIKRIHKYQITGNLEHLVDAANLCLVEFVHSNHPRKHFRSEDDGEHAEPI